MSYTSLYYLILGYMVETYSDTYALGFLQSQAQGVAYWVESGERPRPITCHDIAVDAHLKFQDGDYNPYG